MLSFNQIVSAKFLTIMKDVLHFGLMSLKGLNKSRSLLLGKTLCSTAIFPNLLSIMFILFLLRGCRTKVRHLPFTHFIINIASLLIKHKIFYQTQNQLKASVS